jgi:hypothetical protein
MAWKNDHPLLLLLANSNTGNFGNSNFSLGEELLIPMTLPLSLKKYCWDSARLVDTLTMHQKKTKN